jgi:hypothetical protein
MNTSVTRSGAPRFSPRQSPPARKLKHGLTKTSLTGNPEVLFEGLTAQSRDATETTYISSLHHAGLATHPSPTATPTRTGLLAIDGLDEGLQELLAIR